MAGGFVTLSPGYGTDQRKKPGRDIGRAL